MRCFCGQAIYARGLCGPHYRIAQRTHQRRQHDADRALVIHTGRAGLWVRRPHPAVLNALLTWDAADRARREVAA